MMDDKNSFAPGDIRQAAIILVPDDCRQTSGPGNTLRLNHSELGHMPLQGVDRHGLLTDQLITDQMQGQNRLL